MNPANRYSDRPMTRMQFLMLGSMEAGASLAEATDAALAWASRDPGDGLFDVKPYSEWASQESDRQAGSSNRPTPT